MSRFCIERPGKSERETRLCERYAKLLTLHDRCRTSVATASRLPSIAVALAVVRLRIAALNIERKAA